MTLNLSSNAQRYNVHRWANLFPKRLGGFIECLHLSKVPQLPASATSHFETGCTNKTYPGAAAILRDRLTIPCPECSAEAEPVNRFHDLTRCHCLSCHLSFLVSDDQLRSVSGWGKAKRDSSG
jgi:hypothetical protein